MESHPVGGRPIRSRQQLPQIGQSTSRARVDLPEPETPVTTVNRPSGMRASTLRRLCSAAPRISMAGVSRSTGLRRELECRSGAARQRPVAELPRLRARRRFPAPPQAAAGARAGAQIDHMVGAADRVLVVFDHDQGIALAAQSIQRIEQCDIVARVQPDGGLVQHVAHALQIRPELRRQANALRLAARERGGRAIQLQIAQAHVAEEMRCGPRAPPASRARCRVRGRAD